MFEVGHGIEESSDCLNACSYTLLTAQAGNQGLSAYSSAAMTGMMKSQIMLRQYQKVS